MQSRWNDTDAALAAAEAKAAGLPVRLGLRAYTGRLLGQDADLAPHGGDISVKIDDAEGGAVIHVSTPGMDLGDIAASDLPALRLAPLLGAHDAADGDGTRLREAMIDPKAPAPSARALLHAGLPHAFVDHTPATAILALADQPDMAATVAAVFGGRLAFVPNAPGLLPACLAACAANPQAEGMWLAQRGLLTFGTTARESYERTIRFVTLAEEHLAARGVPLPGPEATDLSPPDNLAYHLTEALAGQGSLGKPALDFRSSPSIRRWLERADLSELIHRGPASPDHAARLRPFCMILPPDANLTAIRLALLDFAQDYRACLDRHAPATEGERAIPDPLPRAVLVPGLGAYGIGRDARAATIAGDLLEQTARIVNAAEDYGRFTPITGAELFAVDLRPPEPARPKT